MNSGLALAVSAITTVFLIFSILIGIMALFRPADMIELAHRYRALFYLFFIVLIGDAIYEFLHNPLFVRFGITVWSSINILVYLTVYGISIFLQKKVKIKDRAIAIFSALALGPDCLVLLASICKR